jgi:hypothetical protein
VAQRFFIIRDKKLREVSDISDYYDEVLRSDVLAADAPKKVSSKQGAKEAKVSEGTDPDSVMQRIIELEARLQSGVENERDTPALRALIDELYEQLG